MKTLVAFTISPMNAPHKELDYLPLAGKDLNTYPLIKNTLKSFAKVGITI